MVRTGQHDRGLAGPLGDDPAAGLDDDRGMLAPGLQHGAGLDGERGAGADEQLVSQVIDRVAAQRRVGSDLAVEAAAVEQLGAFGDGELGPGAASAHGQVGLLVPQPGLPGPQLQHELPQARSGDLALPDQLPVGGGEEPWARGGGGHSAGIDGLGAQLALGAQRGEPAALAAAGPLQVGERAVAAAVVVGVDGAVQPDGLAGAVAGPVGPQRQLQRLRVAGLGLTRGGRFRRSLDRDERLQL